MPERWFTSYVAMLPRLEAEQTQRMIDALLAAGGRRLSDQDHRAYRRALTEQSEGGRDMTQRARPNVAQLQRMGLKVVHETGAKPKVRPKPKREYRPERKEVSR